MFSCIRELRRAAVLFTGPGHQKSCLILSICLLTNTAWGSPKESIKHPYVSTLTEEEVERTLNWYLQYSNASLSPARALPLRFSNFISANGEVKSLETVTKELQAHGIFKFKENCLLITPEYRAFIWWKSFGAGSDDFAILPQAYELVSIESLQPLTRGALELLQVKFKVKVKEERAVVRELITLGWNPYGDKINELSLGVPTPVVGAVEDWEITMEKGEYGYFLPIPREPICP